MNRILDINDCDLLQKNCSQTRTGEKTNYNIYKNTVRESEIKVILPSIILT